MALTEIATFITAAKNALDLIKGIRAELPKSQNAVQIETQLANAEQALEISRAELAKAFGYHLCDCTFPPQIMLREEKRKASVCPNCDRMISSVLRRRRNRSAMAA
jgi:hypothetical protein